MSGQARANSRVRPDRALLPAGVAYVVYLALALFDGAQSPLATAALAIGIWWAVALLVLLGPRPALPGATAWVALGSLALISLLIAASSSWTADDGRVYLDGVRAAAYLGGMVLLVVGVRAREVRPILGGLAAALVTVALLALGSRYLPSLLTGDATFLREFPQAVRGRLSYPVGYWNGLAAVMAGGVVLLGWLGSHSRSPRSRSAAVAGIPLLLLVIYLSGSRGGLLAAVVGVSMLLALAPVRTRALAGIAIGAGGGLMLALAASTDQDLVEGVAGRGNSPVMTLLVIAVVAAAYVLRLAADGALRLPKVPRILEGRYLVAAAVVAVVALFALGGGIERVGEIKQASVDDYGRGEFSGRFLSVGSNGRLQLWESAFDAWKSEPLHGIGSGSFTFWWNQNGSLGEPARDAHSLFIESLAELGPLGLAATLALFGAGAVAVRRLTFGDADGIVAALAGLLAAGFVGAALDWTWEIPAAFSLNLVAIGLLVGPLSLAARARQGQAAPRPVAPRALLAGRIAVTAVALLVIAAAGSQFLAQRSLDHSRALAEQGDLAGAAEAARDAARLQPASEEPWLQLGQVQTLAGDYDGGIVSFREAIERSPQSPQANLALAVALYSVGDPGYQEQEDRALSLFPSED